VSYRDDHDAAIARAEALEREAAALRDRNETLARENEVLVAERAKLAEQVAAPKRALARLAGGPARAEAIVQASAPGRLVSTALHAHTGLVVAGAATPIALTILMAAIFGTTAWALGLALLAVLPAVAIMLRGLNTTDERRERKLLAALPLPLDVPGYLAFLDAYHGDTCVVTVRIELATEPDAETARLLVGAAGGSRLDGNTLVITSPTLRSRSGDAADNVRIHRWFRRLIARVLLPIAAAHPVTHISVA
jgi:hypothetical protein